MQCAGVLLDASEAKERADDFGAIKEKMQGLELKNGSERNLKMIIKMPARFDFGRRLDLRNAVHHVRNVNTMPVDACDLHQTVNDLYIHIVAGINLYRRARYAPAIPNRLCIDREEAPFSPTLR